MLNLGASELVTHMSFCTHRYSALLCTYRSNPRYIHCGNSEPRQKTFKQYLEMEHRCRMLRVGMVYAEWCRERATCGRSGALPP